MSQYFSDCIIQNFAFQQLTFASVNALVPCVIKLRIGDISALFEPSTTASTAAIFAGLVGSTLGTHATTVQPGYSRRHGCFCGEYGRGKT